MKVSKLAAKLIAGVSTLALSVAAKAQTAGTIDGDVTAAFSSGKTFITTHATELIGVAVAGTLLGIGIKYIKKAKGAS